MIDVKSKLIKTTKIKCCYSQPDERIKITANISWAMNKLQNELCSSLIFFQREYIKYAYLPTSYSIFSMCSVIDDYNSFYLYR